MGNTPSAGSNQQQNPSQLHSHQPTTTSASFYSSHTNFSAPLKVVIRGAPSSGKTSLFRALQNQPFNEQYEPTDSLQVTKLEYIPQSSLTTLNSIGQVLNQTESTNALNISHQIDLTTSITVELVDAIDNGKRAIIPSNRIPNKTSLPPGIDLIDGNYYQPPADSTTIDVYKNASIIIFCINPFILETYHYAVNLLQHIPNDLLENHNVSIVLAVLFQDYGDVVDQKVTKHMLNMVTQGTTIQTLYMSNKNGYGVDKLRTFLLIPYLQLKSLEYQRLSQLYQREMVSIQNKYLLPYLNIQNDPRDYHLYCSNNNNQNNNADGNLINDLSGTIDRSYNEYDDMAPVSKAKINPNHSRHTISFDDDFMMSSQPRKTNKDRFHSMGDEDELDKAFKPANGKKKSLEDKSVLKVANTRATPVISTTGNLTDFFGDVGGFDDGDILQKPPKEKKKKKVVKKSTTESPIVTPSLTSTVPAKKNVPPLGGFFDDDDDELLDIPVKTKKVTKSKVIAASPAKPPHQTHSNFASGFFDDAEDIVDTAPKNPPATFSHTSVQNIADEDDAHIFTFHDQDDDHVVQEAHNFDEEAELAIFDDTVEECNQVIDTPEITQDEPHLTQPDVIVVDGHEHIVLEGTDADFATILDDECIAPQDHEVNAQELHILESDQLQHSNTPLENDFDDVTHDDDHILGFAPDTNEQLPFDSQQQPAEEQTVETLHMNQSQQTILDDSVVLEQSTIHDKTDERFTPPPPVSSSILNFYDDDGDMPMTPAKKTNKDSSLAVKSTTSASTFFDNHDDFHEQNTIAQPQQQLSTSQHSQSSQTQQQQSNFDGLDDFQEPCSPPVKHALQISPQNTLKIDFDDTEVLMSPSTTTKKARPKKLTEVEKEMEKLKKQQEKQKLAQQAKEETFTFKRSGASFYD